MVFFFFFNDTATTEIYTLSLHDALPISVTFRSRLTLAARAAGGSLSTDAAGGESRGVGEAGIQASVRLMRWLALRGGGTWRSHSTTGAPQRWTTVGAAAEARPGFTTSAGH